MRSRASDFLQAKTSGGRVGPHGVDAFEPLQHRATRLCLLGLLPGEVAANELFRLGNQALLIVVSALLGFAPLFPLDQKRRIVPDVARCAAVFEFDVAPASAIQNIPTVRHFRNTYSLALQIPF